MDIMFKFVFLILFVFFLVNNSKANTLVNEEGQRNTSLYSTIFSIQGNSALPFF